MPKFTWRSVAPDVPGEVLRSPAPQYTAASNPDLAIRNLLDDPRLRACLAPREEDTTGGLPLRVRGTSMSADLREGVLKLAS